MSRTATVYGAGVAGMATALRLRNQGFEVTVMEWTSSYGYPLGSARHFGYRFELGPSMITLPAVYRDLFIKTGAPLEEVVDLQPVDVAREFVFTDGTRITTPGVGLPAFAHAIAECLGDSAAQEWRALMRSTASYWSAVRQDYLHAPRSSGFGIFNVLKLHGISALSFALASATSRLNKFTDTRLASMAEYLLLAHDIRPKKSSELAFVWPYVEQEFGLWHIDGGASALADAMYQRCIERGVKFDFNVYNVDSSHYSDVAVDQLRFKDKLPNVAFSNAYVICAALNGSIDLTAFETVFLPSIDIPCDVGAIAITSATPSAAESQPHRAIRIAVPAPRVQLVTHEEQQRYAHKVFDELASRGLDIRDLVSDFFTYVPTQMWTRGNEFQRFGRSGRENRTKRKGVYRVGGDAHPGGGAEFSLMGAEIVAELVRADFPKSKSK